MKKRQTHRGPLRKVVSTRHFRKNNIRHTRLRVITLECGHEICERDCTRVYEKKDCAQCGDGINYPDSRIGYKSRLNDDEVDLIHSEALHAAEDRAMKAELRRELAEEWDES